MVAGKPDVAARAPPEDEEVLLVVEEACRRRGAAYAAPLELAVFSKGRGGVHHDARALPRFKPPDLPADLNPGFDMFKDRDRQCRYPAPLDPVAESLQRAGPGALRERKAVVTWRGNVAKLLQVGASRGASSDAWWMEVEALDCGLVVLNVVESPANLEREAARGERERRLAFYGFQFESQCTQGETAGAQARGEEPIDSLDSFCSLCRTGVGENHVLLAGEVDTALEDGSYGELKVSRLFDHPGHARSFERHKMLKFWAQSFALGVRKIVVGFRDDDGFVRKVDRLDTLALPHHARGVWDPQAGIDFLDACLSWIRQSCEPGKRYRLEYPRRTPRAALALVRDDSIRDFIPEALRELRAQALRKREADDVPGTGDGGSPDAKRQRGTS